MIISKQSLTLAAVLVVCGLFLTSCGGGSGGGSSATTINGISVPPEPDATQNNATIAGVDTNNNGVRDDVERSIAKSTTDVSIFNAELVLARAFQGDITGNKNVSDSDYNSAFCDAFKKSSSIQIDTLIINNNDRELARANSKIYRETPLCN